MDNKKDTNKKIKFNDFINKECAKYRIADSFIDNAWHHYKIFGLYKYNPKISHWKNFCNRLKWPLPHEKLKNVHLTRGDKFWTVLSVWWSYTYAFKGGPKCPAFWVFLFLILAPLSPIWIIPLTSGH
jgi:hypothetical protein